MTRLLVRYVQITAILFLLPMAVQAQWTPNGNDIYNSNSGNVAIGTSSPSSRFTVVGTGASGWGSADFFRSDLGGSYSHIHYGVTGDWYIRSSLGTGNVILQDTGGNVGVGTTTPSVKLQIGTGNFAYGQVRIANTDPEYASGIDFYTSAAHRGFVGWRGSNSAGPFNAWGMYLFNRDNSSLILGTNDLERMRIDWNGNVGIGTTNPSSKLDVNGDVTVSGNISAKYQDIAEWVPAAEPISPGTVVIVDSEGTNTVLPSSHSYDTRVAGVVSALPGIVLGEQAEGKVKVATTGRVRVRVDASHHPIRAGDLLVTSDKEGVAMKSEPLEMGGRKFHQPGTLIGKALEALNEGEGEILVLLSLQ